MWKYLKILENSLDGFYPDKLHDSLGITINKFLARKFSAPPNVKTIEIIY